MSDLIERKAAIDFLYRYFDSTDEIVDNVEPTIIYHGIEQLPSIQEIIHCKDCKWKDGSECVRFAEIRVSPNDFCSRAEMREENDANT